jgi:hypothetical protein
MGPLATLSAVIPIALPLAAADQKLATAASGSAQPPASLPAADKPAPVRLSSQATPAEDPPLVAATRRTNRRAKKSTVVIETLTGKGAHVTTTASQPALVVPLAAPGSEWEMLEMNQVAARAQAKIEREADVASRKQEAAVAARYEGDSLMPGSNPARIEHQVETPTEPRPQPTPPQKP